MTPSNHVLILDYPQAGPYDRDAGPAFERGVPVNVVAYEELTHATHPATVILNAGDWPITASQLDLLPNCRCIISYGVGVDWIDLELAASRGVLVVNTPGANAIDVAEHALTLILACSKRLLEHDRSVRAGDWRPDPPFSLRRLAGQTIGYLAFGNIARELSRLVAPLGVRQCAYDPYVDEATMLSFGVQPADWDTLAATTDICSVHLPATRETRGFLDARRLGALKPGSILVITSRGAVYDADALYDALASGHLAAAGLDVFPTEPLPAGHPLSTLPNVILTPHTAAATLDADTAARDAVAASLAQVLDGEVPSSTVRA